MSHRNPLRITIKRKMEHMRKDRMSFLICPSMSTRSSSVDNDKWSFFLRLFTLIVNIIQSLVWKYLQQKSCGGLSMTKDNQGDVENALKIFETWFSE